jgi:hypothetical protein
MRHGIFAVDPGGHTGVAWGVIDTGESMVKSAMLRRELSGSATLAGPERDQIRELYDGWTKFKRLCVVGNNIPTEQLSLVFEDFVLRGGQHAGGKDGTMPERVAWGFEGYRMARRDVWGKRPAHYTEIIWQQAGQASRFGTRPRLESWNAWIRGKEHERSAWAHFAVRVAKLLP